MYRLYDCLDLLLRNHGISSEETEVLGLERMARTCLQHYARGRPSRMKAFQNLSASHFWRVFAYQDGVELPTAEQGLCLTRVPCGRGIEASLLQVPLQRDEVVGIAIANQNFLSVTQSKPSFGDEDATRALNPGTSSSNLRITTPKGLSSTQRMVLLGLSVAGWLDTLRLPLNW